MKGDWQEELSLVADTREFSVREAFWGWILDVTEGPSVGQFRFDFYRNAAFARIFPIGMPAIGDFYLDDTSDWCGVSHAFTSGHPRCRGVLWASQHGCDHQNRDRADRFHTGKHESGRAFGKFRISRFWKQKIRTHYS